MARQRNEGLPAPVVRVAPLGELRAYTVYEHELEALARGPSGSLFLNFALAVLPVSLTLVVTLLTTQIESDRLFLGFFSTAIILAIAGVLFLLLWWREYRRSEDIVKEIKGRLPPPPGIAVTNLPGIQTTSTPAPPRRLHNLHHHSRPPD
jgi:hypothetical protein